MSSAKEVQAFAGLNCLLRIGARRNGRYAGDDTSELMHLPRMRLSTVEDGHYRGKRWKWASPADFANPSSPAH